MGVCQVVILKLQGLEIQEDFLLFDLGGADMVLGIEWLKSLGEIRLISES